MLDVPASAALPCAPATYSTQTRTPSTYAVGRGHAGGWAVGSGRHAPDFEPGCPSWSGRSNLGAVSSKSASLHHPAGRRQAATSGWLPQEQPDAPAGGEPGSEGAAGAGRVRGRARAVRSVPVAAKVVAGPCRLRRIKGLASASPDLGRTASTSPTAPVSPAATFLRKDFDLGGCGNP